jgi:hypothetical protein
MLALYTLLVVMIITREPGTINLSGQRRFISKLFSFIVVTVAKTLQLPLITFMLKIFSCQNEVIYFDRVKTELSQIQAKAAASAAQAA